MLYMHTVQDVHIGSRSLRRRQTTDWHERCESRSCSRISADRLKSRDDSTYACMFLSISTAIIENYFSFSLHTARFLRYISYLIACCACLTATNAAGETEKVLGLHAQSDFSVLNKTCLNTTDSLFRELVLVLQREMWRADLNPQLRLCTSRVFASYTTKSWDGKRLYFVDMPAGQYFSRERLGPVLAHELIHVWQYEMHGSFVKVKKAYNYDIRAVELAADFGAGYLLSQTDMANVYEMNPELSGRSTFFLPNTHGTTSERTEAFRRGLDFTRRVSGAFGIERAMRYYRENLWIGSQ